MQGTELRVKGKVQGVGFRPFVWQLAHQLELTGEVLNDGEGVIIRLPASPKSDTFIARLQANLPPLARIDSITSKDYYWSAKPDAFAIVESKATAMDTQVVPDAASCPECLNELYNPADRRYHYPFINCTHCGPRFTIIHQLPYDRPKTVMHKFPLCPTCTAEYRDPADRRYHAQPVACEDCGPQIWLTAANGETLAGNWLEQVTSALKDGKIVAIRSIGGFHLACDASNPEVIQKLRDRKRRQYKPFAIMLASIKQVNEYADCCASEREILTSRQAPIVLLKKKTNTELPDNIAPGLNELGIMLASNPLQHLIATHLSRPLVMTSGNASGLPPALTNEQALEDLAHIADLFVLHNRSIVQRCDDSLIRMVEGKTETLRRSRGMVPDAINLPDDFPDADGYLAYGSDLKNSFAIGKGRQIIVSQYLGDLANLQTQQQYREAIAHFTQLYQITVKRHVVDLHPGYYSHQFAATHTDTLIQVQHHHAHIAACLMENHWPLHNGKVLALALDGLGMGDDNSLWGAELMLADYRNYQRLGGIPPISLVGGDLAAKQPWRSLHAHLKQFSGPDDKELENYFPNQTVALINQAIKQKINCHQTRSAGRLFDAVAASLSIFPEKIEYEGQAACHLQALAEQYTTPDLSDVLHVELCDYEIDMTSFWRSWLNCVGSREYRAWLFHNTLAKTFARLVLKAQRTYHLQHLVLTGGVFHNTLLRELIKKHLNEKITILEHHQFSCGDGGLSLGQLAIALAKHK